MARRRPPDPPGQGRLFSNDPIGGKKNGNGGPKGERERAPRRVVVPMTENQERELQRRMDEVQFRRDRWDHQAEIAVEIDRLKRGWSAAKTIWEQIQARRPIDRLKGRLENEGWTPERIREAFKPRSSQTVAFLRMVEERKRAFIRQNPARSRERKERMKHWITIAEKSQNPKTGELLTKLEIGAFVLAMIEVNSREQ